MIDAIKKLRDKTNAGVVDCKKALKESGGDVEKAIEILRKQGAALATKKVGRATKEGRIESYIHLGGKIGVLIEVDCESDFVARNDDFKTFVKNLAMQVAASNPIYVNKEDVPEDILKDEKDKEQFLKSHCLLEQPFVKDTNLKVKDVLTSMIAKIGENIVIKRFVRWNLGEEN